MSKRNIITWADFSYEESINEDGELNRCSYILFPNGYGLYCYHQENNTHIITPSIGADFEHFTPYFIDVLSPTHKRDYCSIYVNADDEVLQYSQYLAELPNLDILDFDCSNLEVDGKPC